MAGVQGRTALACTASPEALMSDLKNACAW